jgi:hypothetical protein
VYDLGYEPGALCFKPEENMVINIMPCPGCKKALRIPQALGGNKVQCRYCGAQFIAPWFAFCFEIWVGPSPKQNAVKPQIAPATPFPLHRFREWFFNDN